MYKVQVYKKKHLIRGTNRYWKVIASNGKMIGKSTEGYKNRKDCIHNAKILGNSLFYKKNYEG